MSREVDGFEEFFARRYEVTRRALALVLGDVDLADDASQEAFARALQRWSRSGGIHRPDGWVVQVGLNYARDVLRRRAREERRRPTDTTEAEFTVDVESALDVRAELAGLSDRRREAIVLRYYLDLTLEDVAIAMGCAIGTAKSTLHAALEELRLATPVEEGAAEP